MLQITIIEADDAETETRHCAKCTKLRNCWGGIIGGEVESADVWRVDLLYHQQEPVPNPNDRI